MTTNRASGNDSVPVQVGRILHEDPDAERAALAAEKVAEVRNIAAPGAHVGRQADEIHGGIRLDLVADPRDQQ